MKLPAQARPSWPGWPRLCYSIFWPTIERCSTGNVGPGCHITSVGFRLYPTREQEALLLAHCGHARYVWNLAVEQLGYARTGHWRPNFAEQCRQLADARGEHLWLAEGSSIVQQQALRDFDQAMKNWRGGTHRRPSWRRKGRHEGFRIVNPPKVEQPTAAGRGCSRRTGVGSLPALARPSRVEVVSGGPRRGGPVACRVRCGPRTDPRAV
jgi:hypothetical protein